MKKYLSIISILILLFILIYSANFYFLSRLSSSISNQPSRFKTYAEIASQDSQFAGSLDEANLKSIYRNRNPQYELVRSKIVKNFVPCAKNKNYSEIWDEANSVSFVSRLREVSVSKQF